jgi:cell division GTPase FtsZ
MLSNFGEHDLNTILYHCGKISGYSNMVDIEDLQLDIKANINTNEIKKAKGAIIVFRIHPDIPIKNITQCIETICKNDKDDFDCIFDVQQVETLQQNRVHYFIFINGL